jgi:hypothetical protein
MGALPLVLGVAEQGGHCMKHLCPLETKKGDKHE